MGALGALGQTLGEYGPTLRGRVEVNVWLTDIADLPAVERSFDEFFPPDGFPARMAATTRFVDADCLVMIDATAHRGTR